MSAWSRERAQSIGGRGSRTPGRSVGTRTRSDSGRIMQRTGVGSAPIPRRWIPERHRPFGYEPGTSTERLISGVDIVPTMLSMAGIELPPDLQGMPFLGPAAKEREYAYAHRDRVLTHVGRSRAVVGRRFHYIRNYMPEQPAFWPPSLYQKLDIGYDEIPVEMLRLRADGTLAPGQEQVLCRGQVRPRP